jgi:hypothetical protein
LQFSPQIPVDLSKSARYIANSMMNQFDSHIVSSSQHEYLIVMTTSIFRCATDFLVDNCTRYFDDTLPQE